MRTADDIRCMNDTRLFEQLLATQEVRRANDQLERLAEKGFVDWEVEETTPGRGGHPRRRFRVTSRGMTALRVAKDALFRLWEGLDGVLDGRANK